MKKYLFIPLFVFSLVWAGSPFSVMAQSNPPYGEASSGIVKGRIIDQNNGSLVSKSLDIMLHVWDQQYVDLEMEHGQSQADGTFEFSGVAFEPQRLYAVMAIFEGVTYYSDIVPGPADFEILDLTVPVIESTRDLTAVQIDQMHLLFDFAQDGMDTTEIYVLSNLGDRTVKEAVTLEDGQATTLRFSLPSDADFIFFQPDEQDRFIKIQGGFADSYPLRPGEGSGQFMVQYLVPFSPGREYAYTAPVNVRMINFLLPADSGISLEGQGLAGPQPYTLQSGNTYQLYFFENINAGETVQVVFKGNPVTPLATGTSSSTLPLALGGAILGLTMVGVGFWWWRRPEDGSDTGETVLTHDKEPTVDDLISEIARLDEEHEQGFIGSEDHQRQRQDLLRQVKKHPEMIN